MNEVNVIKACCQITLVLMLVASLFVNIYRDINGYRREPAGFSGVAGSIAIFTIAVVIFLKAGLMSELR
jgi:hypothetical protein